MNRRGPMPARASPARDRRRDRHCGTEKSRKRASSAPPRASHRALWDRCPSATLLLLLFRLAQTLEQLDEPLRDALVHDIGVHRAKLLADLGLDVLAQSGR